MALRALQGPTGGGTPVGGTGTTNTIPRWTGPSTLGDSGLIDNGTAIYTTTRDVGFGIASPNAARFQSVGVDDKWAARLHGSTTVGKSYGALIEAGTNSGDIALRIRAAGAGSDYLYVRGDGNVGIGTASPSAKLHVNGNAVCASGTTGMTDGFFYIPGAAGAPTGTPTAVSGRVPMYYDTTNNEFYVYNGAWKKVALA